METPQDGGAQHGHAERKEHALVHQVDAGQAENDQAQAGRAGHEREQELLLAVEPEAQPAQQESSQRRAHRHREHRAKQDCQCAQHHSVNPAWCSTKPSLALSLGDTQGGSTRMRTSVNSPVFSSVAGTRFS